MFLVAVNLKLLFKSKIFLPGSQQRVRTYTPSYTESHYHLKLMLHFKAQ